MKFKKVLQKSIKSNGLKFKKCVRTLVFLKYIGNFQARLSAQSLKSNSLILGKSMKRHFAGIQCYRFELLLKLDHKVTIHFRVLITIQ